MDLSTIDHTAHISDVGRFLATHVNLDSGSSLVIRIGDVTCLLHTSTDYAMHDLIAGLMQLYIDRRSTLGEASIDGPYRNAYNAVRMRQSARHALAMVPAEPSYASAARLLRVAYENIEFGDQPVVARACYDLAYAIADSAPDQYARLGPSMRRFMEMGDSRLAQRAAALGDGVTTASDDQLIGQFQASGPPRYRLQSDYLIRGDDEDDDGDTDDYSDEDM